MRRFWITLILALLLSLICLSAQAEDLHLGQPMADFTVETAYGGSFTLSEALKDRDLVLVNLWASWCEPCEDEFPSLQEAYEAYSDRVAVIALSVEPEDTPEVIAEYAQSLGLTFPMGNDEPIGLADAYDVTGIPTTLLVDRFGNVAFTSTGALEDAGAFTRLFDHFLDEDYAETRILKMVPAPKPDVQGADEAALSDAANAPGGTLAFANGDPDREWPMLPEEVDGRTALASSNANVDGSAACAYARVTAGEGDALAFDARTSTEETADALFVSVDGNRVLFLTGERDWATYAVALEPGEHEVGFGYAKDEDTAEGEDCAWVDDVRMVSGEEAAALLAAMPARPGAEKVTLTANGREVRIDGPQDVVREWIGDWFFIIPEGDAAVELSITADIQPEISSWISYYDGEGIRLAASLKQDGSGYLLETPIDRGTDYSWGEGMTTLALYLARDVGSYERRDAMLFSGEEALQAALENVMAQEGCTLTWRYADDDAGAAEGERTYAVSFVDQHGDPVPGCVVNFCTDELCAPVFSDEAGVASFIGEPYAYHLQVIKVPDGYSFDTSQEFTADPAGGEMTFVVEKVE